MKLFWSLSLLALQCFVHWLNGEILPAFGNSPEERAMNLLNQMNLTEKLIMMQGVYTDYNPDDDIPDYTGIIAGNDRLGIPPIYMQDGPQGFRAYEQTGGAGSTTQWPSALTVASSWDPELLNRWATAMAAEFTGKGANVALGPGMGIARVPVAGRNFEYLCGEDPSFCSVLVKEVIHGFQDNGVIANAKHFVNNEIENNRQQVSANVDERTRFELYYPPFQAAVEAGVLSVMCSYNRINDIYACENPDTLTHLRENLGFKGWVMSDWWAAMSTGNSVKAGLDQEMPYGFYYSNLTQSLNNGEINEDDINTSVSRILTAMFSIGLFDTPNTGNPNNNVTSEANNALAREIAAKSTVLAKNAKNLLPLDVNSLTGNCIAVFGDETTTGGGGSGAVEAPYIITPQQGLRNALENTNVQVYYHRGFNISSANELAKSCDIAVVVVATNSGEGNDRESLSLGTQQDNLIYNITSVNPKTIVAVTTPGAVLMPWINEVSTCLVRFLPGQENGNALADILLGKINPSGRLPITMPNKDNEIAFSEEEYPGVGTPPEADYNEELLIGYRWYDAYKVTPVFPFGHGLSYTTFDYSNLEVNNLHAKEEDSAVTTVVAEITCSLKNIGKVTGSEIVQLYVSYPKSAKEPPKQLRSFVKVNDLASGSHQEIKMILTKRDLSIWNADRHEWEVMPGRYQIMIGSSSKNIKLQSSFAFKE